MVQAPPSPGGGAPANARSRPASSQTSKSAPSLHGSSRSSPFKTQPPFQPPMIDKHGFAKFRVFRPAHTQDWDEKHHLEHTAKGDVRPDNALLQTGCRHYFSAPQTTPELRTHLSSMTSASESLLKSLDLPEEKKRTSPFSADTSPSGLPERYTFGGTMTDRDKRRRPWNNRWSSGMYIMNEGLHKAHRTYFSQNSIYETMDSQQWRRYRDQETSPSNWVSTEMKKPHRFPPMGV
mmetsp:Transcript_94397/g.236961  ORF Transcript_94397/g.236961 Transcript_94397/m.236961 type:complete len:235 (-) Transcript_94397:159-863(-)|eukprot:CAMPEP_0115589152 /NCGR_PEP_ID=MMETSP0272-20121206/9097_1 /TAXON_ID=71861 /ORGANISM="Scrippsiella trochoidea, Strain CCMP3099" /LENGTH=234 /DNA_ID=CAMNT_0003024299 /DNA_START=1 /DNA_END=705 /DNA_ORIENTATION=-